jgi:hypothetical protein
LAILELRRLLAVDWGDAPDLGIGTGVAPRKLLE